MYVSMPALSMHILTHNLNHKCNICGKAFSRPWLLQGNYIIILEIGSNKVVMSFFKENNSELILLGWNIRAILGFPVSQVFYKDSFNSC